MEVKRKKRWLMIPIYIAVSQKNGNFVLQQIHVLTHTSCALRWEMKFLLKVELCYYIYINHLHRAQIPESPSTSIDMAIFINEKIRKG